jgi:hypothetical protein
MGVMREAFLEAARSAVGLLTTPEVAAAWDRPSALAELSVSGLAGHLANQVFGTRGVLDTEPLKEAPVPLLGHYSRVTWIDAAIDDVVNMEIRATGERVAEDGPRDLVDRLTASIGELSGLLMREPDNRLVKVAAGMWNLTLDDYLITRMMEIAVHSDDLAASVGIQAPALPGEILDPVLELLTKLALHRHGQSALLCALTRRERAPESIAAF